MRSKPRLGPRRVLGRGQRVCDQDRGIAGSRVSHRTAFRPSERMACIECHKALRSQLDGLSHEASVAVPEVVDEAVEHFIGGGARHRV